MKDFPASNRKSPFVGEGQPFRPKRFSSLSKGAFLCQSPRFKMDVLGRPAYRAAKRMPNRHLCSFLPH
jgi:hypothetical protein